MWLTQEQVFILIVGAAILLLGLMLYALHTFATRARRVPFRPLPNYYPGAQWYSKVPMVLPKEIVEALTVAEQLIIENTPWGAANMALVGHHVRVYVEASEAWSDLWSRRILGSELVVGPSLSGLAHELAHLAARVLENDVQEHHLEWQENGVVRALDLYAEWLARRRQVDRVASGVISLRTVLEHQRYGTPLWGMVACRFRRPA